MGLDKNFVVRNGLEIASELIFADSVVNKTGIGTTTPGAKLDVNGTSSVSGDFRATGVATVGGRFDVGVGGTAFQVNPGSGRIGINTAIPEYNLDVIGDTGISSHLSVGGITTSGILHVTGLTSSVHLNVTGVTTIADARINAGFTTVTYSEAQLLNVTGVATVGGAVTMSSTGIDVNNIDVEALTGRGIDITGNIDATTYTGDGSAISGIVTTLVAGENIALSGGTGTVTIAGLAKTDNIKAETLVVSGVSTLGVVTGVTAIQATNFYGGTFFGDGSNLSGIDTTGNFSGKTIVCENVLASNPGVGTFGSVVINNPAGRITATEFYGDGSNLTNTGSTLSAASGTERVVFTNLTTGTMTASSTDADVTFDSTNSKLLLGTDKITLNAGNGEATFSGTVLSGGPDPYTGSDLGSFIGYEGNAGFTCGSTSSAIRVWTQGNSTPTVNIEGSGSATFRGNFLNGTAIDYIGTYVNTNDGTVLYGVDANVEKWRINGLGAAQFSGNVDIGGAASSGYKSGALIASSGKIASYVSNADATSSNQRIYVYNGDTSAYTAYINGDGSARFKGPINTANGTGVSLAGAGAAIEAQYNGKLFRGYKYSTGSETVAINDDGSATFKSFVASGDLSGAYVAMSGSSGEVSYYNGSSYPWKIESSGSATFASGAIELSSDTTVYAGGFSAGGGNALIYSNGAAYFAGAITGNLSGNASTSTNCNGTATYANSIKFDTDESTNTNRYIVFADSGGGSYYRAKVDSGLTYNPSTNTLSASTFSGNATSASNATNAGTLDGYDSSTSASASTVAVRDGAGNINMVYANTSYCYMSHAVSNRNTDSEFFSSPANGYIYKNSGSGFRASLNVPTRTGGSASGTWGISINGNASTSTNCNGNAATSSNCNGTATRATDANRVTVNATGGNSSFRMVFTEDNDSTDSTGTIYKDSVANFYYNPYYNTLYVPNLSGNASTSSNCNGNAATSSNCNGNAATSSNCNGSAASASNANYASSAGSASNANYASSSGNCSGNSATSSNCNGNSATVSIYYNNNSNSNYQMLWGSSNSVYGTAGITCNPSSNGISCGSLYATGNVTAYSDIKFKEDIKVIPNALDKVKQIRGVTYLRNDSLEGEEEIRHAGVIAQEVEKVLPEVVIDLEKGKSVAYGNMVALLIEAIKEQQDQIEELKSKLNN